MVGVEVPRALRSSNQQYVNDIKKKFSNESKAMFGCKRKKRRKKTMRKTIKKKENMKYYVLYLSVWMKRQMRRK